MARSLTYPKLSDKGARLENRRHLKNRSVCPSAASYVQATAKSALHRHRALEAAGPRDYFGPSRRPPPGARMRVVTFVVSTFGSLGAQAQTLIKDIGRRTNLFVPFSLADETSWATSSITTFLQSALTFQLQVRKRVAVILEFPNVKGCYLLVLTVTTEQH